MKPSSVVHTMRLGNCRVDTQGLKVHAMACTHVLMCAYSKTGHACTPRTTRLGSDRNARVLPVGLVSQIYPCVTLHLSSTVPQ